MSKNVNWVGINNLLKIMSELGIKQKDLECKGAPNISQLITGKKAITEKVSAPALVNRLKEIELMKGKLEYEISEDLLLGKINIITNDLIKKLDSDKEISIQRLLDIDKTLRGLNNDDSIKFLKEVIQILNKNYCENAALLMKYSIELLKLEVDFNTKMQTNKILMSAYSWLNKLDEIILTAESIEQDLDLCKDKETKRVCYINISRAYYNKGKYDECLYYLKKLKFLGKGNEFFIWTLESAIFSKKKDFEKAERIYFKILEKAKKEINNDYIVDCQSNLACLYDEMGLMGKAKENIDYALESITGGTLKIFKFNAYFNAFLIYDKIETGDMIETENFCLKAFELAIQLKLTYKVEMLFDKAFNRYFARRQYSEIRKMINQVNQINVKSEILLKLIPNECDIM